jgi:hypothetical protein
MIVWQARAPHVRPPSLDDVRYTSIVSRVYAPPTRDQSGSIPSVASLPKLSTWVLTAAKRATLERPCGSIPASESKLCVWLQGS